ncbi:MAG: alpha/beta fold hydrolase [Pseudomonadales bacterium]|jgi:homoserine O-acetyltransferase|nr:alpha/beta fold hydrolase [Pseudomonadales bacterium]|tara:strand:+ start:40 stop:1107 length:1068 start_codon:yes stop_codon:yes gene_type:complete
MKSLGAGLIALIVSSVSVTVLAGGDHQLFHLGNFELESGVVLPDAKLSYVTHGQLNAARDNVILLPSFYSGDHHGYDFLIGAGLALNPEDYFIVATDMFQNGLSSSPSNTPAPFNGPNFPEIAIRDNIEAVFRLLTEEFDLKRIVAVIGFSMGAQQAFQWAVSYPDFMKYSVGYCGSAVEHPHGIVRLEGFKTAIMADSVYNGGNYTEPPAVGLAAGATHWAAWGTSQEWYRKEMYKLLGLNTLDDVYGFYQDIFSWDANDLIWLASTWQNNNVGDTPGFDGNYQRALGSIKAKVLYMPCETDMYFHIDALRHEAEFIPDVQFTVIPTLWGHIAGGGSSQEDATFINKTIREFLR